MNPAREIAYRIDPVAVDARSVGYYTARMAGDSFCAQSEGHPLSS